MKILTSSVIVAVIGFCALFAFAGESRPLREAVSGNGNFKLVVTLGKPNVTPVQSCRGSLLVKGDNSPWQKRWDAPFVNDVTPTHAFVRDDAKYIVTLGEYEKGGARHALVIYGDKGQLLRHFLLTDLLTSNDWKHVSAKKDAIRWLDDAKCTFDDTGENFVITLDSKREIRISLSALQVIVPARPAVMSDVPTIAQKILFGDVVKIAKPTEEKKVAKSQQTPTKTDKAESVNEAAKTTLAEEASTADTQATEPTDVPMPNLSKHVDYLAWLNGRVPTANRTAADFFASASKLAKPWPLTQKAFEAALVGDEAVLASPELSQWIVGNFDAVAMVRAGANCDVFGLKYEAGNSPTLYGVDLARVEQVQNVADILAVGANRLAKDGKADTAMVYGLDVLSAGARVGQGATIVECQVGAAIEQRGRQVLRRLVKADVNHELDYSTLTRRLDADAQMARPFEDILAFEHTAAMSVLQYIYTPEKKVDESRAKDAIAVVAGNLPDERMNQVIDSLQKIGYDGILDETNAFYEIMIEGCSLSPKARLEQLEDVVDYLKTTDNHFLAVMASPIQLFSEIHADASRQRQAFRLAMHLKAQAAKTGQLPPTLKAMSKSLITDPATGRPFGYEKTADGFRLSGKNLDGKTAEFWAD